MGSKERRVAGNKGTYAAEAGEAGEKGNSSTLTEDPWNSEVIITDFPASHRCWILEKTQGAIESRHAPSMHSHRPSSSDLGTPVTDKRCLKGYISLLYPINKIH